MTLAISNSVLQMNPDMAMPLYRLILCSYCRFTSTVIPRYLVIDPKPIFSLFEEAEIRRCDLINYYELKSFDPDILNADVCDPSYECFSVITAIWNIVLCATIVTSMHNFLQSEPANPDIAEFTSNSMWLHTIFSSFFLNLTCESFILFSLI